MNSIEIATRKFSTNFEIDVSGFVDMDSAHEIKNLIYEYVCANFADKLPSEKLLGKYYAQFAPDTVGEWYGREEKAARTMQTIFDRALAIAKTETITRGVK